MSSDIFKPHPVQIINSYCVDNQLLSSIQDCVLNTCESENYTIGDLIYYFITDDELLEINREALNHDYFTDIITFDYVVGKVIHGEIYISIDRVLENAKSLDQSFSRELNRVAIHGVLHLMGWEDDTFSRKHKMREKENEKLEMFHVER